MRFLSLVVIALAAPAAAAQDTLRFNDPARADLPCEVTALTCKTVQYEIYVGGAPVKQSVDARDVLEIRPDPNKRSFDFISGQSALESGDFPAATQRLQRVMKDGRASPLLRQLAAIGIVRAQSAHGDAAATLAAADALQQEFPESFFLAESFEIQIRSSLARNDLAGANKAVSAFETKGKTLGLVEWAKSAVVLRASLLERQQNWKEALAAYQKYSRDKDVGAEATLGEMRCLAAMGNWQGLKGRAQGIIGDRANNPDPKLLMGAYNGRGEAHLQEGQVREALLDFMQGVTVFVRRVGTGPEHERALARAAVACARMSSAAKDLEEKKTYKVRAGELAAELKSKYPGSALLAEAREEIQKAK